MSSNVAEPRPPTEGGVSLIRTTHPPYYTKADYVNVEIFQTPSGFLLLLMLRLLLLPPTSPLESKSKSNAQQPSTDRSSLRWRVPRQPPGAFWRHVACENKFVIRYKFVIRCDDVTKCFTFGVPLLEFLVHLRLA